MRPVYPSVASLIHYQDNTGSSTGTINDAEAASLRYSNLLHVFHFAILSRLLTIATIDKDKRTPDQTWLSPRTCTHVLAPGILLERVTVSPGIKDCESCRTSMPLPINGLLITGCTCKIFLQLNP